MKYREKKDMPYIFSTVKERYESDRRSTDKQRAKPEAWNETEKNRKDERQTLMFLSSYIPKHIMDEVIRVSEETPVEEIRLRVGKSASVTSVGRNILLGVGSAIDGKTATEILSLLCGGSLYAFEDTIKEGYISLEGGVRVGISGRAGRDGDHVSGIYDITSFSFRIPHRSGRVAEYVCDLLLSQQKGKGILVYSPPGVGKTTVLRSAASILSVGKRAKRTVLIDSRGELSCFLDDPMSLTDTLIGYPKKDGIEIAARCLSAEVMICDEIGDTEEAEALLSSQNVGVPLLASAHGASLSDVLSRPGIQLLHDAKIFGAYVKAEREGSAFKFTKTDWGEADAYLEGGRQYYDSAVGYNACNFRYKVRKKET